MSVISGSIPASALVNVLPGVLNAGGNALNLNQLILTNSWRVPIGTVYSFSSATAVGAFFGLTSTEYFFAGIYFQGFTGATALPSALLFAQYNSVAVGAYLKGGSVSALTLTQLQAISGTLSVVVNGSTLSGSITLSAATGFSSAAGIIITALSIPVVTQASFTGAISGTTLTVSAEASGTIAAGQTLAGSGVTAGTTIVSQLTGTTGGVGTYQVSSSQTVSSGSLTTTLPGLVYDSISGAFVLTSSTTGSASTMAFATGTAAASLCLTAATGAVLSQGAVAAVPGAFMTAVVAITQNWADFTYTFNPDGTTGLNTVKLAFATWASAQNYRYAHICWDTDIQATQQSNTENLGYLIQQANLSGTLLIYDPNSTGLAAFVGGYAASLNFNASNGRNTLAYLGQVGIPFSVTSQQIAANLMSYGYNFYGAYATANQSFTFMQPGSISGPFLWADSFFNQIWMNSEFQLSLLELMTEVGTIPYNTTGQTLIRSALIGTPASPGPIDQAISFGAIVAGTTLSSTQTAAIDRASGVSGAGNTVASQGYFLLITNPSPQVQAARGTPTIILWYADGESVQNMTMSSIDVE